MLFQQKQSSEEGGAGTIALDFLFLWTITELAFLKRGRGLYLISRKFEDLTVKCTATELPFLKRKGLYSVHCN